MWRVLEENSLKGIINGAKMEVAGISYGFEEKIGQEVLMEAEGEVEQVVILQQVAKEGVE